MKIDEILDTIESAQDKDVKIKGYQVLCMMLIRENDMLHGQSTKVNVDMDVPKPPEKYATEQPIELQGLKPLDQNAIDKIMKSSKA